MGRSQRRAPGWHLSRWKVTGERPTGFCLTAALRLLNTCAEHPRALTFTLPAGRSAGPAQPTQPRAPASHPATVEAALKATFLSTDRLTDSRSACRSGSAKKEASHARPHQTPAETDRADTETADTAEKVVKPVAGASVTPERPKVSPRSAGTTSHLTFLRALENARRVPTEKGPDRNRPRGRLSPCAPRPTRTL